MKSPISASIKFIFNITSLICLIPLVHISTVCVDILSIEDNIVTVIAFIIKILKIL